MNPWNKLAGYEVLLTQRRRDAECAEVFVAIEPLLKGQESNRALMETLLAAAADEFRAPKLYSTPFWIPIAERET